MPYPGAICPGSRPPDTGWATDSACADPGPRGDASPGSSQAGPRASPRPRACSAEAPGSAKASGAAPAEARPSLSCPGQVQDKGCGS